MYGVTYFGNVHGFLSSLSASVTFQKIALLTYVPKSIRDVPKSIRDMAIFTDNVYMMELVSDVFG